MINTKDYSYSISEVVDVLRHTDEEEIAKIPFEIIKRLNENKLEDYVSVIDFTKPLEQSEISSSALCMLAYIYREYLCTDEEKREYDKILYNNDIKRESQIKEKYNKEDLFKNNKEKTNLNLPIEIPKESFLKKIINKIKKYFCR